MSEVNTYKKITDVEQIETLNDAATVFINDNGAMKQVAANEFGLGTVKTVNGIEPDENGNIKSDIAVPVLITHLKFPMFDDIKCNKTYEELHHSFLTQSTEATSIALCLYTALDKSEEYRYCTNFVLEKDNGEFTKRYFLYFGEDVAPYIIDVDANTITLDPNWIKPEENVQPDWNQNDETAPDYVKNRTHYNNQFRQVINLDPAKDFYHTTGGYHIGGSGSLDPTEKNNGYAIGDYFLSKQQLAIFPGIVKFDDIVIEFTGPRRLPVTFRLTNNEFPQFQFHQHGSQIGCDILYADNKPHTFEWIDTHFAETVPLDEKYIPDTIARTKNIVQPNWSQNDPDAADYVKGRTHYTKSVTAQIADNVTVTIANAVPAINPFTIDKFIEGRTYTVTWDGATYECVAYIAEGPNVPSLGNAISIGIPSGGNGEPFFITASEGESLVFGEDGTHTLSMIGEVEVGVRTLDPKYLPDGIEYAEKDIFDTVHGDPAELQADYRHVLIENAPYPDFIANHNTCFVDVVTSGSITLRDGTKYSAAGAQTVETTWKQVFNPSYGDTWKTNIFIPLLVSTNGNSYVNINEIVCHPGMTSLDASFNRAIPTNFTGSITVEVTLRASNREMAAQSISMWSSTEGSTKRFRITVDDSGTLTATEV